MTLTVCEQKIEIISNVLFANGLIQVRSSLEANLRRLELFDDLLPVKMQKAVLLFHRACTVRGFLYPYP